MKLACSPLRFANTTQSLSEVHHGAIQSMRLGGLLHIKPVFLRRQMLVNIANRYNNESKTFHICNQDIEMTPPEVKLLMELPIEGNDVKTRVEAPIDKSNAKIH